MGAIKILHTADLHLDAPFPSFAEKARARRADFLRTFERLVTLAIKSEVHLFLVSGDLFDSPRPSPETIAQVQAGVKRLKDRGIVTLFLPGTHDAISMPDSVYRRVEFPGTYVIDHPVVESPLHITLSGEEVWVYAFAYQGFSSSNALETMKRRFPNGIHIGLLHGSRQGSPEWDYRQKDLPFTLPALKSWGLDYVALGHYHGFDVLEEGGRIYAAYSGSPEGKRFGENGPRYCAIVTIDSGVVAVERVQVNSRTLEERVVDLSGCEDFEKASELITSGGNPDLILRLTLTGIVEAPLDLRALHARCSPSYFHLQFEDKTRLFDSEFARRIEQEETVRGLFVRHVRSCLEKASEEDHSIIEEAFREVLVRFRAFDRGGV